MNLPKQDTEVLAKISHQNSLGESHWYEVVYHNGGEWRSFHGSKTFDDGEQVDAWVYCGRIMFPSGQLTDPEYGGGADR